MTKLAFSGRGRIWMNGGENKSAKGFFFKKEREWIIVCMFTWALLTIFEKFVYVYNTPWSYPPLSPSPKFTHSSATHLHTIVYRVPLCGWVWGNTLGHGQATNCSSPLKKSDSHGNIISSSSTRDRTLKDSSHSRIFNWLDLMQVFWR